MKTNETGRSMVEMLGVLAIIGVLSVAGIAGYTQAMKKNKVNNAVAEISMAVILARTSKGGEGLTSAETATTLELGFSGKALSSATIKGAQPGSRAYEVYGINLMDSSIACADLQNVAPSQEGDAANRAGYFITCE